MFTLMICSILYIILVIEKKRKFGRFTELVNSMDKFEKIKSDLYEDLVMLVKFSINQIFSNFFYICLVVLMYNVIVTISLLNFVFMMFFFVFLTNSSKAKKYWIILLLYM